MTNKFFYENHKTDLCSSDLIFFFFNTKQICKIGLGTKIKAMNPSIDIMNG